MCDPTLHCLLDSSTSPPLFSPQLALFARSGPCCPPCPARPGRPARPALPRPPRPAPAARRRSAHSLGQTESASQYTVTSQHLLSLHHVLHQTGGKVFSRPLQVRSHLVSCGSSVNRAMFSDFGGFCKLARRWQCAQCSLPICTGFTALHTTRLLSSTNTLDSGDYRVQAI